MDEQIVPGEPGWHKTHIERYLTTDGREGHYLALTFSPEPEPRAVSCLVLKTIGRKSGKARLNALVYGADREHFVIVASRGGAGEHPAWYLNLRDNPDVEFQIGERKYRGRATVAKGLERVRLFEMMAAAFPPYHDYQQKVDREIPVITLLPIAEIEAL